MSGQKKVVILGAGFGGLSAARALFNKPVQVVVIDRNNYHTFLPLLYQVSTAELEPVSIAIPIRGIFRGKKNINFMLGEVKYVDFNKKSVKTKNFTIPYDYLIISTGSSPKYFGVKGAKEHAYPLRNLEHGIEIRNHILKCFEKASKEEDKNLRRTMLTFTVVGGGPTGIEFAGAILELIRGSFKKDYPNIDFSNIRIILIEATGKLLGDLPEKLGEYAREKLEKVGVEVRLGTSVREIEKNKTILENGEVIQTATVIWTAGVQGDPSARRWRLPTKPNGQVQVLPSLQVQKHPHVYVIGDLTYFEKDGKPLHMVAPVAIQQGQQAVENILRQINGEKPADFMYKDKGTIAVIGRNAAVAYIAGRSFTGFLAWLIWLVVHLANLIGFRNKTVVMINWAWDYFFFERIVRHILPKNFKARK